MLPIVIFIFISSIEVSYGASSCYSCNPCGTTWNPAAAQVIQTSTINDYCRKTVTGTLVVKDSVSTCNPVNVLNNGVYCCRTDLCNTGTRCSLKMSSILYLLFYSLWKIYSYYYYI
ncbi:unnamed protein product [Adineta ricciae]|uniref:Uncharacterized protein n=1 Tax=Adineta ricciae TaxID=249248 RepID=A0A816HE12_ADIRI|nr:unnamed protein product [Adineta ricciae]